MRTRLLLVAAVSACCTWSMSLWAQENKGSSWAPTSQPPVARKAVSKPPAKKSEAAPAAAPVKPDDSSTDAATKGHVLRGEWKVYWIGEDRTTQMNVVEANQTQPGLTSFIGAIGTPSGEGCPITGTVVDSLNGQFAEGIEVRTLAIVSYVVARATCPQDQLWVEAFGLPNGKVLMSGRATFVSPDGKRRYAAIAFGR